MLVAMAVLSAHADDTELTASDSEALNADEIARELANPNNSLASLTFKNQYRWYDGDLPGASDQSNYTLLFQPVFPFSLEDTASGGKANLFVRPALPLLVDQPTFDINTGGFDDVTAFGDIGFDVAYGVSESDGFLWALGMVGTLPTATKSEVAGKQLRLGPEALFAQFENWGVYGIFPSHQWNVTGWSNQYYSTSQAQLFFNVLPGNGWTVGTTPIMNYDWVSEEWTVPLNLTVSKTVTLGALPLKIQVEANYYVARPDAFGPEWMIGLNLTPVVSNFIEAWLR